MPRTPRFFTLALVAAAAAVPAMAQAGGLRAEFAAPFERSETVIVDGRQWACAGTTCTSATDDPRPAVACRKLSRKVGPVARFATSKDELDAAALATCNQGRG
jgi:hypothetical protein